MLREHHGGVRVAKEADEILHGGPCEGGPRGEQRGLEVREEGAVDKAADVEQLGDGTNVAATNGKRELESSCEMEEMRT